MTRGGRLLWKALLLAALSYAGGALSATQEFVPLKSVDLAKPFGSTTRWRLIATQGPSKDTVQNAPDSMEPGLIRLCVSNDGGKSCTPDLQARFHAAKDDEAFGEEDHYLGDPELVYPHGRAAAPLLLIRTASEHGGNGSQRMTLQALAYDKSNDRFRLAYDHEVGGNMNQEMRYIAAGPLKGFIISAEPTEDAPFGYWIDISRPTYTYSYQHVLRFRSATRYGDGNMLAVIDSEMANILKRLGKWHAGMALPAPAHCPRPHLVAMELWCR